MKILNKNVYAFKNNSSVLKHSSSGGAFTAIIDALYTLYNKVIVYGAAFDNKFNLNHEAAYDKEECFKFNGSKYVQSNMSHTFKDIPDKLKNGNVVLFTGTPCQVYSLNEYLLSENISIENLYLVDILCHGVPSQKMWKDYIHWLEQKNNSKLKKFNFRYKLNNSNKYNTFAEFENGKIKCNTHDISLFTKLYFSNLAFRDSCYACKFTSVKRYSDITIGDFWGIEKIMPEYPTINGVSQIIINSDKGKKILNKIMEDSKKNNNIILKKCESPEYLKYQQPLNNPVKKPKNINIFREDYKNKGIIYILKKYAGYNIFGKVKHTIKYLVKT